MSGIRDDSPTAPRDRLDRAFGRCRDESRAALIAYLAAGDPDMEATVAYAAAVAQGGADVLELGVPFSDSLADGPIIQAAYTRALAAGATVRGVLRATERIVQATDLPVVLMTAYNPVLAFGIEAFCRDAAAAGAAGLLVPDLLPEDADPLREAARGHGLHTIFLAAPAGSERRLRAADEASTGFLYLLSRRGVTGPQGGVGESLEADVARARGLCRSRLAVGFGVATPADAARVAALADGVIVGSALVQAAAEAYADRREAGATPEQAVAAAALALEQRVAALAAALHGGYTASAPDAEAGGSGGGAQDFRSPAAPAASPQG